MRELAGKGNIRTANATLKGGREEECVINSLDANYVLFKKVLQLFMTEVDGGALGIQKQLAKLGELHLRTPTVDLVQN